MQKELDKTTRKVKLSSIIILLLVLMIIALLSFGFLYYHKINPVSQLIPKLTVVTEAPKYVFTISPDSKNEFNKPMAVISDTRGYIFVADSKNGLIKIFDPNGKYVSSFGKDDLKMPLQLGYASEQIWVADTGLKKVQIFDADGKFVRTFAQSPKNSDAGSGIDLMPVAVAVTSDLVYVADTASHAIIVFDKDGKEVRRIGHAGNDKGGLSYPTGVWVANKFVYVSDTNNACIQIFNLQGEFVRKIDAKDTKTGAIAMPRGITVGADGKILVVDVLAHTVRALDGNGAELWNLGKAGVNGNGQDEFNFPNGIWLDSTGKLFVTDRENNRVQVFKF